MSKNIHAFELKLGKRALILFVIGMSCLLFIVFLFGVTIGKNIDTYPERYTRGLSGAFVEKMGWSSKKAVETAETVAELPKEQTKAVEEEKGIEEKKEPVAIPPRTEEKQPLPQAMIPAREQKIPKPPAVVPTQAKKPPAPKAVASAKEQKPPATPAVNNSKKQTPPVKERYQVQVVSYKEKEKAEQLRKKLAAQGFKPVIAVTDLKEKGKWYRVTLDGYDSKEQAQKAAESVAGKNKGVNCAVHKIGTKNN
jgi:cell division protein FtsN